MYMHAAYIVLYMGLMKGLQIMIGHPVFKKKKKGAVRSYAWFTFSSQVLVETFDLRDVNETK